MAYLYEERERNGERELILSGYDGAVKCLSVPAFLRGESGEMLPVTEIAAHAFDGRDDLSEVELPKTVRVLRPFSFFNCKHLRRFLLWDSVEDYFDGSLRQCVSLRNVTIYLEKEEHFQIVRDILGDNDRELAMHLIKKSGEDERECLLFFPGYVDKVREDTMARQLHDTIEGCGYSYRQTVGRRQIDFRLYDQLFERAIYDAKETAVYIALGRLRYPLALLPKAEEAYRAFLEREDCFSVHLLLMDKEMEWLRFYLELNLLSKEAVSEALLYLSKENEPEMLARLLLYQEKRFGGERRRSCFSVEDL